MLLIKFDQHVSYNVFFGRREYLISSSLSVCRNYLRHVYCWFMPKTVKLMVHTMPKLHKGHTIFSD